MSIKGGNKMKKIFLLSSLLLFSLLGCEQFIGHSHKYSGDYLADDTYAEFSIKIKSDS